MPLKGEEGTCVEGEGRKKGTEEGNIERNEGKGNEGQRVRKRWERGQ